VQRVIDLLAELAVAGDRVRDVRRLDRHLEVVEVQAVLELDELGRRTTVLGRPPKPIISSVCCRSLEQLG
jgi:hypothetical protein